VKLVRVFYMRRRSFGVLDLQDYEAFGSVERKCSRRGNSVTEMDYKALGSMKKEMWHIPNHIAKPSEYFWKVY
jgi:hypothetical protein